MTVLFQHYKENATDSFSSIIAFLHCSAIKQINQHGQSFKPLPQLDLSIEEGWTLFSNAPGKFKSPLEGNNNISLCPGRQNYQKMKDALSHLPQRFGYKYLLSNVATIRVVTPVVLANADNPTAVPPFLAAAAIPELITYTKKIKILDFFSDQTLEIAKTILWLHEVTNLSQIRLQKSFWILLTKAGRLTYAGKKIITWHFLSKTIAYQVLELLLMMLVKGLNVRVNCTHGKIQMVLTKKWMAWPLLQLSSNACVHITRLTCSLRLERSIKWLLHSMTTK